jgi:peroxiredoxin
MKANQLFKSLALVMLCVFSTLKAAEPQDPNVANAFTLSDQNGKEVKLADLIKKGQIVVLEWINPECPFVKAHYAPDTMTMKKLADKYTQNNKVTWLAVNSSHFTTPQQNQEFVKQHGLSYPILLDNSGNVGKSYGAKTTPHLFIIDADGKIVYRGAIDNAPLGKKPAQGEYVNYVEKAVDELLAGKAVSVPQTKPYGCSVKYAQ